MVCGDCVEDAKNVVGNNGGVYIPKQCNNNKKYDLEKTISLVACELGRRAFREGKMCYPALDRDLRDIIEKGLLPDYNKVLTSWQQGFLEENVRLDSSSDVSDNKSDVSEGLEELTISSDFDEIPEWINRLGLRSLTVDGTSATTIPRITDDLSELYIKNCPNLNSFDGEWSNPHVHIVSIANCPNIPIGEISSRFPNAFALEIDGVPVKKDDVVKIAQMPQLQYLYIRNAGLEDDDMPKAGDFASNNLEAVGLDNNQLTRMPDFICSPKFRHLSGIYLSKNPISEFPEEFIDDLRGVLTLDLSGTKITSLPDDIHKIEIDKLVLTNTQVDPIYAVTKTMLSPGNKVRMLVLSSDDTEAMERIEKLLGNDSYETHVRDDEFIIRQI